MKNIASILLNLVLELMLMACGAKNETVTSDATTGSVDRTILPVRERFIPRDTTRDARNAKAPTTFVVKAPENSVIGCNVRQA